MIIPQILTRDRLSSVNSPHTRHVVSRMLEQPPFQDDANGLGDNLDRLVEAVIQAILRTNRNQDFEAALTIRDELRRLPSHLVTEVLNGVMLNLVCINPELCRWFVLDVFLREADPEGKADVAERINLLVADLRSRQ